jgi:hypothetical protein
MVRVIAKYWTAYLKTITLKVGPGSPLMMAEAFRWHRPCSTTPFTYNKKTTGYSETYRYHQWLPTYETFMCQQWLPHCETDITTGYSSTGHRKYHWSGLLYGPYRCWGMRDSIVQHCVVHQRGMLGNDRLYSTTLCCTSEGSHTGVGEWQTL